MQRQKPKTRKRNPTNQLMFLFVIMMKLVRVYLLDYFIVGNFWVPDAFSPGVKRQGREADHSFPSSAEV
jgi:hypothetical protein